jgi:hypothetical protein
LGKHTGTVSLSVGDDGSSISGTTGLVGAVTNAVDEVGILAETSWVWATWASERRCLCEHVANAELL